MKVDPALNELRELCAKLPGAEQYVMVHHPAFRVGKKPFVIAGMNQHERGPTVSINLGREAQAGLLEDPRFTRTPYIGQHGWVTAARAEVRPAELAELVTESWRRVATRKHLAALAAAPIVSTDARKRAPPAKKTAAGKAAKKKR